jgi:hypothetical protein
MEASRLEPEDTQVERKRANRADLGVREDWAYVIHVLNYRTFNKTL